MLTPNDCNALKEKGYDGGKTGQKIGRAINAWSTAQGIEKHKDYHWRFNQLINGGKNTTDRVAILSINPVDFLTASHGDFASCHSIDRRGDHCYRSGNLSYAMDGVTMVFFTVATGESADYPSKRIDRINYHFNSGLLIQGRLYTGTNDDIRAVSRAMVYKVIADCLGIANLWTKHAAIDQSRIASTGNHYADYVKNPLACSMSTLLGADIPDSIKIGHVAYCISCGCRQSDPGKLDCCNDTDNTYSCEGCNARVHEDDVIHVGDYCYCSNCTSYCDHCERHHYTDDVQWVKSLRRSLCKSCLEDNFSKCVVCGDVVKNDDAHDKDENSYCDSCYHDRFSDCEECDEAFDNDELEQTEDERWVCGDCYAKLTNQESCVLASA